MLLSRRSVIKGLLATGVGALTGATTYGVAYERHRLAVVRSTLDVSGLPSALAGLRIALLTDIHHSRLVGTEDVATAVHLATSERPDLIVLGGDYVTFGDRAFVGPVADLLAPLHAEQGVFAILGNHDDDKDMPAALARKGFTVLRDQHTRITVRGEPLEIAGIRFWTRRATDIARIVGRTYGTRLLLAHDPRRLREAAALNISAVLSGHTHGGQVLLPGVGAVAKAARFPILAGNGRQGDTSIFVSRGVGTVYVPVRLNCPPEVALLTLAPRSRA